MILFFMAHLAIFLKIIAIPFGVSAVIKLIQYYRKYNYPYLKVYRYLVELIFFIMISTLSLFYIFTNLFPRLSPPAIIVESIYCFLTSTARILQCILYVLLYRHLLQKADPDKFNKRYYMIGGLLSAVFLYYTLYSISASDIWPTSNVSVLFIFLVNCFCIGVLIVMLAAAGDLPDKGKQTAVRRLAASLVIPYMAAMVFFFLHVLLEMSTHIFSIFTDFYRLVLYGLPIFYLKPFMKMYHGVLEVEVPDKQDHFETLCRKHNISKREREILQLICEGKTNKEIEEHLFIAISTVKDHVSNIYRKTGVKNRVQLNNLFRVRGK